MSPWTHIPARFGIEPPRWTYPRWRASGTASGQMPVAIKAVAPVSEPTGPAGGDLEGSEYPNPIIAAGKVTLAKLAAAVVTLIESKLAKTEAVAGDLEGEAKAPTIAALKVTTGKLAAAAVTAAKLGAEAVGTAAIEALAVTTAKLAPEAVTNAKLALAVWQNVETVNAKLEQTVTIQVAVIAGIVYMRGLGKVSAEIAAKGILFTLPAAARPATERNVNMVTNLTTGAEVVKIKTNGEVELTVLLAAAKTPSFDGLSFAL